MSRIDEALRRANQERTFNAGGEEARTAPWAMPVAAARDSVSPDVFLPLYSPEAVAPAIDLQIEPAIDLQFETTAPKPYAQPAPAAEPALEQAAASEPRAGTARELPVTPQRSGAFANEKLIVNTTVEPLAIEQYRKLAVTLHQMQVERGTKIVMIASAMASEGKTLTASNLSLTLSESFKRRVLLIDADMRRPSVHEIFKVSNSKGLGSALTAIDDEKLTLIEVSPYLTILPAGRPDPNPMSGLTSDRMRRILAEASAAFDWVVVDTPPVGVLPDANILAEMVDTVVFVIGAGQTPFKPIQRAVDAVGRQRIVGVVLNRVEEAQSAYQYYARHYYARSEPAVASPQ